MMLNYNEYFVDSRVDVTSFSGLHRECPLDMFVFARKHYVTCHQKPLQVIILVIMNIEVRSLSH